MILVIETITADTERVFYDGGNGLKRKAGWLNNLQLKTDLKEALIGFHVCTGIDFIPAFFKNARRGVGREGWKSQI